MARNPNPIPPRLGDMRKFEEALRRAYLQPMFRRLAERLAQAEGANQAYRAMDDIVQAMAAMPQHGIPTEYIQAALNRMNGYHYKRVIQTFRAALGVDVRAMLAAPEVNAFMGQKLADSVDLIKTIQPRMHESLTARLRKELAEAPFDKQRLRQLLKDEYKSAGYNLRRITSGPNE